MPSPRSSPRRTTPRADERRLSKVRWVRPEVRHLAYFVAVAEELNFTRAAARLNVVQQALSAGVA